MPRLNDASSMDKLTTATGSYGFSATKMDDLGASEYTLVQIVIDTSGSVDGFRDEIERCVKEAVNACKSSPRADNLMIRMVEFNSNLNEIHGFKLFSTINVDDYNGVIQPGGMTALFDASVNGVEAMITYGEKLSTNEFSCNAILIVITDGADNQSTFTAKTVGDSLKKAVNSEALESIVSILIGVNVQEPQLSQYLKDFETKAGFSQYVELANANAKTLAKLAAFISKSISAQSQALGTGGPSKSLSF